MSVKKKNLSFRFTDLAGVEDVDGLKVEVFGSGAVGSDFEETSGDRLGKEDAPGGFGLIGSPDLLPGFLIPGSPDGEGLGRIE